jgi:DNA (cytosine-5)-methyltransferase 1
MTNLKCFDLCCGAGGISLGFSSAGLKILGGIDKAKYPVETAQFNHANGKWDIESLEELVEKVKKDTNKDHVIFKANILLGGLPCQGFSTAGKRDSEDERNYLYKNLLTLTQLVKPQFVVFENVKGLIHDNNSKVFDAIIDGFNDAGYEVHYEILNAKDFGVPQKRERVIIIASAKIDPKEIFKNIKKTDKGVNVRKAFAGLARSREKKSINHTFMKHSPEVVKKIKEMNGKIHLSYRRLKWDEASSTVIVGHNALPVHPEQPRAISVREAARLQGFPDSFIFKGTRTSQSEQVANAVPPPLAKAVAKAILKSIKSES